MPSDSGSTRLLPVGLTIVAAGATILAATQIRRHRTQRPTAVATPEYQPDPASVPPERPLEYRSVAAHFEATAKSYPNRVALRTATQAVTYDDLFASACGVRDGARRCGQSPRAALIPGSLDAATVSTILGLIAAGTVVVALDPELPRNRTDTIAAILAEHDYDVVPVESAAGAGGHTLGSDTDTEDVTSIQFTSGSTGTPKAVLHTNGLWLADAQLLNERFGLADGRTVALCMPISFAGGLNVLIGSLLGGAEIVAVDPREHTAREAFDRIKSSHAQAITCTPSFVDALHRAAVGATLPHVTRIVTTGEPIQARHVKLARELAPDAVVTNWVGSTETLAIASHDIPPAAPLPRGVIPVGIAAPHKKVEINADGIVSITSRYLGRGYLDPSASTATFVDNGNSTTTYVGGDVGRWDEHGNLVFSGRADNTVKIRGYLVEPAEIEAMLASYTDIREVAVVADCAGTPTLTAYVAPSATARTPSAAELRTRLHRDLPPWMVPANIEILANLPRGERGKVDRMALPKPTRVPFESPCDDHESTVATLWADVLRIDRVGRTDSFYALGGDSLSVAQMLVALRESHGIALKPTDLASAPTVASFAQTLAAALQKTPGAVARRALRPTTTPLRPLSAETAGAPLFCFTGAGASALCFLPLAEHVGDRTAVYAFEPSGLSERALPDWSIQRAVQRHWTDLRRIQPHGPYTLVGHSLGAHIALETARALQADGETVEMVVMLDPWLSPRVAWEARKDVPGATVTLQTDDANGFGTWWERQKTVPLAGLFSGDYDRKTRAIEEVGMMAAFRYRPAPWDGRALLILSHLNTDDPRLWRRILTGQLESQVLDCDHHSIVRAPHIGAVADTILAARDVRC
ncbi:acyl-CoA synthetase (AMP-forming)/AMP-acid ligase II [Mycobacterium sp. BK086]|uniref:alpha/beta fold hydrolase n=1 Tax=Mycobacterium sp. BK086 TaxID=2512165 RepID=UPI0010616B56|nr:alpha/beta fold hydrolase [Mycobacterium sp. BK086]TDO10056.1 acyl-CoA synthetase (AMP-forming)/AMP-acid ligase II [Mycobacterium sp. BK086]